MLGPQHRQRARDDRHPRDITGAIWPIAVDYFKHAGIALTITDEAAFLIENRAARENRPGARALREVFGSIIKGLEFDPMASGLLQEQERQQVLDINRAVGRKRLTGVATPHPLFSCQPAGGEPRCLPLFAEAHKRKTG